MVGTAHIQSFLSGQVGVINVDCSDERSDDLRKGFGISVKSNPTLRYYLDTPRVPYSTIYDSGRA